MPLDELLRRDVATTGGVLELRSRPEAPASERPVVLAVTGRMASAEGLARLPDVLGFHGEGVVLPIERARLADPSVAGFAAAIEALIASTFQDREVVLFGVSVGATICLAVRAPNVRRIVAVEPTDEPGAGFEEVVAGLAVPADVILGEPAAAAGGPPSLVAPAWRAQFAAHRMVRLHRAEGAGHNVQSEAPRLVIDVVVEACRRAAASHDYDPRRLDEALLEAAPLAAPRLAYWGPDGETFRAAYLARSPRSHVRLDGEGAPTDVLVLGSVPDADALRRLADGVAPDGLIVARWPGEASLPGFAPPEPADGGGTGVARLRRRATPRLRVELRTFAPLIMDIRTRLPAQMLASAPDLVVSHQLGPGLPALPRETAKVAVLQRPGDLDLARWRRFMAGAIAQGWVVAMEFDDHPRIMAETHGDPPVEGEMERFRLAHAIQTSTPPLAEAFRAYNPEVAVFPNAVFELLRFPEDERPRRVFYGGVLRGAFPVRVAEALGPAVERFPDTEFVVIGDRAVFDALPTARKSFHDYMSYEAYLRVLAGCAVSLSPLEARPFHETKSDAKYLDAARAGVLTIASPTVYARTIRHGVNGLLAAGPEDWAAQLVAALGDGDLRTRIARAAWEDVRDSRMFADQLAQRRDWYWSLWARRDELNARVRRALG